MVSSIFFLFRVHFFSQWANNNIEYQKAIFGRHSQFFSSPSSSGPLSALILSPIFQNPAIVPLIIYILILLKPLFTRAFAHNIIERKNGKNCVKRLWKFSIDHSSSCAGIVEFNYYYRCFSVFFFFCWMTFSLEYIPIVYSSVRWHIDKVTVPENREQMKIIPNYYLWTIKAAECWKWINWQMMTKMCCVIIFDRLAEHIRH